MKQYNELPIPRTDLNASEWWELQDLCRIEKGPLIVLTKKELREVWEGAVSWLSGLEFGNHSLPNFEQFIESKGIKP